MDVKQTLRAIIQIAEALAKLHGSDVVHRNIRPQTIRIDPTDGRVELTGISDSHPEESLSRGGRATSLVFEALPYIAPEQTGRMNRPVDHRADFYSLGVTAYEMFSGALPLTADEPIGWVHSHVARAPRPLAEAAPNMPPIVCAIVMKLLAKSADDRYQSARGLIVDLTRCLTELEANGRVEPFPLGSLDVWDKLRIPTRLYGRENDVATLFASFARVVAAGTPELVLVTGYSGIGKSVLVYELQRPIARERGYFITGKFDQHKRDIPYAALAHTFRDLVQQVLTTTDAGLMKWRAALAEALGSNGRLITDLVPELELIIDPQPAVPPLPPSEAQTRIHTTFRRFLGVFATREHPLLLFLDDLQWADVATLRLLSQVIAHPDMHDLLLIGAYRDNEVETGHPLVVTLNEIEKSGVRTTTLSLGPLAPEHLRQLVADTLRCEEARVEPLAALLAEKTGGNPFFVTQFLTELNREHLLWFDAADSTWKWNLEQIQAKGFTDNIVEFMLGKLRRLPAEAQRALMLAACIGNELQAPLLAVIDEAAPEQIHQALAPAVRDGLLLRRGETYKFLHDRVQQAAYALIAEEHRSAFHWKVGRLLLERTPEAELDGRLFDLVNHLNLGASRVTTPDERRRLVELNLRAGRKAKAGAAYQSAVAYFLAGTSLLAEEAWEREHTLTYAIHFELAEGHLLNVRADEAERLCGELLLRAQTKVERASAYRLWLQVCLRRVDIKKTIEVLIECVKLFGIELSASPSASEVLADIQAVRAELRGRQVSDLLELPIMKDPEMIALMNVLAVGFQAVAVANLGMTDRLACQMVRISVAHGTSPDSPRAYAAFGATLCGTLKAYDEGFQFGKLAYDMVEKYRFAASKTEICYHFADDIAFWTQPLRVSLEYTRIGWQTAIEMGNVVYACIHWSYILFFMLFKGDPLDEVRAEVLRMREFVLKKMPPANVVTHCFERFILNMQDRTAHFSTWSGDGFEQEAFEAGLSKAMPTWRFYYLSLKLQARFLSEDYGEAMTALEQAKEYTWTAVSKIQGVEYYFYGALTVAAVFAELPQEKQAEARELLAKHEQNLRAMAQSCPDNFLGKHLLVCAEIARLEGRPEDAAKQYEAAAGTFRTSGFVQCEGLAHRLAASFYQSRGLPTMAGALLREARVCYARWGAAGKVRQLDLRYPDLLKSTEAALPRALATSIQELDISAIVKATQLLSSEMVLEKVVTVLMQLVIEHSSARRACLLLIRDAALVIAAQGEVHRDGIQVRIPSLDDPLPLTDVPASVIHYVKRTAEKVILDDASTHKRYAADDYITRERTKSVLCVPVSRFGSVMGVLYLENNLAVGTFTPGQLALVELLTAQAASSLENARLYTELTRENAQRQHTEAVLLEKFQIIERQQQTLRQLATPIIEVWEGVLAMPVVGVVDSHRAQEIMDAVLSRVDRTRCRYAIIDLTGVEIVDSHTAEHILRLVMALRLLGAQGIVVGIRPDVARTVVSLGVDLASVITLATLRDALVFCMNRDRLQT